MRYWMWQRCNFLFVVAVWTTTIKTCQRKKENNILLPFIQWILARSHFTRKLLIGVNDIFTNTKKIFLLFFFMEHKSEEKIFFYRELILSYSSTRASEKNYFFVILWQMRNFYCYCFKHDDNANNATRSWK